MPARDLARVTLSAERDVLVGRVHEVVFHAYPEFDLYIELTTLRQRLVTYKNRKLRQLRERYPQAKL